MKFVKLILALIFSNKYKRIEFKNYIFISYPHMYKKIPISEYESECIWF